ncbi:hypothetical protein DVH24_013211 [Malus domestica]|uniref:Uncharacterized protein n=1 Tax=Malus domestica TaxID=3750 RepID=A0A498IKU3_MALDO|nr:hypothetical protein DVH24_013211 [Malus domestica]
MTWYIVELLQHSSIASSLVVVVLLLNKIVLCSGRSGHKFPIRRRIWCKTSCRLMTSLQISLLVLDLATPSTFEPLHPVDTQ